MSQVKYRGVLAYDGTAYQGFQRQADGIPSIQAAVERAIKTITRQEVPISGAGRTDTGVHATGQVISFEVEWRHGVEALLKALNQVLPDDIALQSLAAEPDERFHPRFSARSRAYAYTVLHGGQRQPLLARYTWQVRQMLDVEAMQAAAALLIGEHDFATFGHPPYGENTVREVFRSGWTVEHPRLIYHIEATAFLQHMVRRIVGMLVEVGRGRLTLADFEASFRAADLAQAKTLAPPQGLVLEAVRYTG